MGVTVKGNKRRYQRETLGSYVDRDLLGFPVELIDSAVKEIEDGEMSITIPNVPGLIAAACVARVLLPQKLCGKELKSIRKALELTGKELAAKLNVREETLSRWENERDPIGPTSEMYFRMFVVLQFKDRIGFEVDQKALMDVKIEPVRLPNDRPQIRLVQERRAKPRNNEQATDRNRYKLAVNQ